MYAGQEATVRTGHGTTDWFQIGNGVRQGCILSPCLFNFYAEYIMRKAGLEETQAGIKIAGRNISQSDTEREVSYAMLYIWNRKRNDDTNERTYKTDIPRLERMILWW